MSEGLKLILITSGFLVGVVGLLFWVARRVFSGEYYPKSWVQEQRDHYNEQLAREREIAETYRVGQERLEKAFEKQSDQLEKVLEGIDFVKDFVVGIKTVMQAEGSQPRKTLPRGRGQ